MPHSGAALRGSTLGTIQQVSVVVTLCCVSGWRLAPSLFPTFRACFFSSFLLCLTPGRQRDLDAQVEQGRRRRQLQHLASHHHPKLRWSRSGARRGTAAPLSTSFGACKRPSTRHSFLLLTAPCSRIVFCLGLRMDAMQLGCFVILGKLKSKSAQPILFCNSAVLHRRRCFRPGWGGDWGAS